jgi:hypothetical protein
MSRIKTIIKENKPLLIKEFAPFVYQDDKFGYRACVLWRYHGCSKWHMMPVTEEQRHLWRLTQRWALLAVTKLIDKLKEEQYKELKRTVY